MSRVTLALLLLLAPIATIEAEDHGLVDLFNGKNLNGWTQRNGTATYRIEDKCIVGKTSEGSPNSFLCTDKKYGDFELMFEVMLPDGRLNSGVQIRSQTKDDNPSERVNGPQVEISTDRMAGYIYGEAAGGWMTKAPGTVGHAIWRRSKYCE